MDSTRSGHHSGGVRSGELSGRVKQVGTNSISHLQAQTGFLKIAGHLNWGSSLVNLYFQTKQVWDDISQPFHWLSGLAQMLFGVCWESSHPLCWTFPSCLVINMDGGGWILCTWAEGLRGLERWDVAGFHFLESEFWVAAAQWCLKNCLVRLCKEPVLIYADYCSLFSAQALLTSWVKTSSSLMVKCQAVGLYHPQTSRGDQLSVVV